MSGVPLDGSEVVDQGGDDRDRAPGPGDLGARGGRFGSRSAPGAGQGHRQEDGQGDTRLDQGAPAWAPPPDAVGRTPRPGPVGQRGCGRRRRRGADGDPGGQAGSGRPRRPAPPTWVDGQGPSCTSDAAGRRRSRSYPGRTRPGGSRFLVGGLWDVGQVPQATAGGPALGGGSGGEGPAPASRSRSRTPGSGTVAPI
jgi:hypothetical protein